MNNWEPHRYMSYGEMTMQTYDEVAFITVLKLSVTDE